MSWLRRTFRRTFDDWEKEIARPILVTVATAFVVFAFSLLLKPVRQFLFDDRVPYPIYCTAESYSTSADSERTEIVLINTTSRELSRTDLTQALTGTDGASPDLQLVYTRDIGAITAEPDAAFNLTKGEVEVTVQRDGKTVLVSPRRLEPRAILRVNIDVTGLPDDKLTRDAHDFVRFRIKPYEEACYRR